MRRLLFLTVLVLTLGCESKPKELGPEFAKFDGYYFLDAQLKGLKQLDLPNKDSVWFGRLDVKNAKLDLIEVNTWKSAATFNLEPYKPPVFFLDKKGDFYLHLDASSKIDGQHGLDFIRDKDNKKSFITGGYFVHELKSIEDCKKFLEDWKADLEKTNCKKESCYGN